MPQGFTPLHVAARCGRLDVLRVLLDGGMPVDCSSTPAETTPLHLAGGFGQEACVKELLRRGADPSRANRRGATPLDLVGALLPPNSPSSDADSNRAKAAFEKMAQVERVRTILTKGVRWKRRRDAVLVCEVLRSRALSTAPPTAKRFRGSRGSTGRAKIETRPWQGASGKGSVIEQLCAQAEPVLIRKVIRFL